MKKVILKSIFGILLLNLFIFIMSATTSLASASDTLRLKGTRIDRSLLNNINITIDPSGLTGSSNTANMRNNKNTFYSLSTSEVYTIKYENALTLGTQSLDIIVNIEPIAIVGYCQMEIDASDDLVFLRGKGAVVDIDYSIVDHATGNQLTNFFCFGFRDPDGADYTNFSTGSYQNYVYYVDGDKNAGNELFPDYYHVKTNSSGKVTSVVRENIVNTEYADAWILIGQYASTAFSFRWDTYPMINGVANATIEDYLKLPAITYSPKKLYFQYDMNNGYLAPEHGSAIGTSSSLITNNGNTKLFSIYLGASLGTNGLTDYNNESYINIKRWGYYTESGKEFNSKADGTGTTYSQSVRYKASNFATYNGDNVTVTLYVKWVKRPFAIAYTLNGGTNASGNPTSYYYDGGPISIANPSRQGYNFAGWKKTISGIDWRAGFLNATTGAAETNATYPNSYYSGYISLKANVTYTITGLGDYDASHIRWRRYDSSAAYLGTTSGATYTPSENCLVRILLYNAPNKTTRNGLVITGNKGETSVGISKWAASKVSLSAQWTEKTATLTYNANGHGTAPSPVTMKYTTATNAASAITVTGYDFQGWNTKADGTGTSYAAGAQVKAANVVPTAMTLYAQWKERTATLTYNANGHGTAPSSVTMKYSTATNAASAITATGYTFGGWNTKADGTGTAYAAGAQVKAANVVPTETTLYAQWSANTYRVIYNGNGGTQYDTTNLVARYDGYYNNTTSHSSTLTSWKDMRGNLSSAITNGTWGTDHLVFDGTTWVNLGQINSNYMTIEITFSADEVPTATQDLIGNWQTSGGGIFLTSTGIIRGQFYIDGEQRTVSSGITVSPNVIYHVVLTYDGTTERIYVNGEQKASLSISGTITPPQSSTIMVVGGDPSGAGINKANFVGKVYNFSIWNTSRTAAQIEKDGKKIVTYGSTYGSLPTPARTGYTFNGWYTAPTGGSKVTSSTTVNTTGNRILYARWTATTNPLLTIDPNGGSVSVTSPSGGTAETITDTTEYEQAPGTTLTVGNPTKASTTSTSTYTISYNGNGGEVAKLVTANTTSKKIDTINYTFSSWTRTPNPLKGTLTGLLYTYPTDVTSSDKITANYTSSTTPGIQGQITLPEASKLGYTFLGWYTAASGGTRRGGIEDTYTPSGSETLYAHWSSSPISYTISYNLDGGTNNSNNPASYNVNSNNINIQAPTKTGYQFVGWQKTITDIGWQNGYIFYDTGVIGTSNTYSNSHYSGLISLKEGTTYTLGNLGGYTSVHWRLYDTSGTFLGSGTGTVTSTTFTPTQDCYARILFYGTSTEAQRSGATVTGGIENNVNIPTGSTGNITLTANWSINTSSLTVNPNGGNVDVTSPTGGTLENIETSETYTQNYNTTLTLGTPTKEDLVETDEYVVTYNYNDGITPDSIDTAINTETTVYTFSSWTKSSTFYGTLSSNNKTYTFPSNNNVTSTITAAYNAATSENTTPIILETPTRPGYVFNGWYTAATGGTKIGDGGDSYTPTANITLHAQWTAIPVTITIKKDNANWNANSGIKIELRQSGSTKYSATASSGSVSMSPVEAGTYDIYASKSSGALTTLVDTGIDLTVTSSGTVTIDYYTLTLQAGVGISAVSGGGTFLKGQTANIDATVANGYTWEGWSVISGNTPD